MIFEFPCYNLTQILSFPTVILGGVPSAPDRVGRRLGVRTGNLDDNKNAKVQKEAWKATRKDHGIPTSNRKLG